MGSWWCAEVRAGRECLGIAERTLTEWQNELLAFGLVSKRGRHGIAVHRRLDDVEEAQRKNAVSNRRRLRATERKPKRQIRTGPRKRVEDDGGGPLFCWANANRHISAGSRTVDNSSKRQKFTGSVSVDHSQPVKSCRSEDANRQNSAAQPVNICRVNQKTKIKSESSKAPRTAPDANKAPPTDDEEAIRFAQDHGVDLDLVKQLLDFQHQVRTLLSSRAVVEIELAAGRSHPEGGTAYVDTLIEHCGDRLEREAIAVVDGEKFGLWTELIADEDPIEIPF